MAGASTNKTLLLAAFCSKTINDTEYQLLDITEYSMISIPVQISIYHIGNMTTSH